jgi:hypothetical protein
MGFFTWCKGLLGDKRTASQDTVTATASLATELVMEAKRAGRLVATRVVRASRPYSCKQCQIEIAISDRYGRWTYRASGKLETDKLCLTCHALMAVDEQ